MEIKLCRSKQYLICNGKFFMIDRIFGIQADNPANQLLPKFDYQPING